MFIVDAHEDIGFNALHYDRDVRRSTSEQRVREAATRTAENGASALTGTSDTVMIGLPDLRRGGVGLVCSTIFSLPGEQEAMTADAWAQLRYYQGLAAEPDAAGVRLISTRAALDALIRDHTAAKTPDTRP